MSRAEDRSRLCAIPAGLTGRLIALAALAAALSLLIVGLVGIALLITGLLAWLNPADVASAWARTLGGIGLIGGSAGFTALGWQALARVVKPSGSLARPNLQMARNHIEGDIALNRTPNFIAAIGILLALICLPFAAAIEASAHESSDSGGTVTREFPWSGGDRLELDIPGQVHFHPAPTWHLTMSGRAATLDELLVSDGRIREKDHGFGGFFDRDDLGSVQIELSGPALREAILNGSGSIDLQGLRQDSLRVEIRGSGWVGGSGTVRELTLKIMGSGSARLQRVAETNADVAINGSGNADVSPSGETQVTIAGSGDVRLHSHPAHLNTHVYGSGRITEVR
jgi:hypothetical protein